MAHAKVDTVTKTVMVPSVSFQKEVTVTLSEDEAKFLKFVIGLVGGHPGLSPRLFATRIRHALVEAGVDDPAYTHHSLQPERKAIYFRPADEYHYGIDWSKHGGE